MFYIPALIFHKNSGYSYSPKRFIVEHSIASFLTSLAFHARIALEQNQTKKRSSDLSLMSLRSPCLNLPL